MQTLTVRLTHCTYPIHIGEHLIQRADLITPHLLSRRVAIVSNTVVAPLYLQTLQHTLEQAGISVIPIVLPDGEAYKDSDTLTQIYTTLIEHHAERTTTLIALGGGVIGDLTGYAAATYLRGVPFIQIPTTLLAQVDSSVGGKTGINHPLGKNMIGAFYQPKLVLSDTETLQTLSAREFSAGMAEVIKYGLICDEAFFNWLESNHHLLMDRTSTTLRYAIHQSCVNKANIVMLDEHESGERAILNLGHTFGHAIENGLGYGEWLHGEAVSAGMVLAAELSYRMNWLSMDALERIKTLLQAAGLPIKAPNLGGAQTYLNLMQRDKKVQNGRLRLVLQQGIGKAIITNDYSMDLLQDVLTDCVSPS